MLWITSWSPFINYSIAFSCFCRNTTMIYPIHTTNASVFKTQTFADDTATSYLSASVRTVMKLLTGTKY